MGRLRRWVQGPGLLSRDRNRRESFVNRIWALPSAVLFGLVLLALQHPRGVSQNSTAPSDASIPSPGKFSDVTSALGVNFQYLASHTSKKYLLETMGSGVALFDYDNDGRLDIFLANGARLDDPTPKGTIPNKDDAKYWNRLYHQKPDGTFEDVTEKVGL